MSNFITAIHVKDLRHLHAIDIQLSDKERRHLLITGKNGSGKTTLLDAIARYLENLITIDSNSTQKVLEKNIRLDENNLKFAQEQNNLEGVEAAKKRMEFYRDRLKSLYGALTVDFADETQFKQSVNTGDFIVAYYKDYRNPHFIEPTSPELPDYRVNNHLTAETKDNQFLKLLVHYKVQGAMEGFEGNGGQAKKITEWFERFKEILRRLFNDEQLEITFNPRDYTFTMTDSHGKSFRFTQLPAGYRAALDIISGLIFKMQSNGQVNLSLNQEGVVLIDEVETHLHLSMQKEIMPILTTVFPNIQFIVSTHSPFVLSSVRNAEAIDLENPDNTISDLTDYSYEALAEGYFGTVSSSSDIQDRLLELEYYVDADQLSDRDTRRMNSLIEDFESIPEMLAPTVVGRFNEIMIKYHSKTAKG